MRRVGSSPTVPTSCSDQITNEDRALKIEQQLRDDHQVTLTVEVDPERFERAKRRAARNLSRKAKIPGFRPGKAPYDVIRSFLGEGAIIEEAVENLIDEVYPQAIEESEIEPAAAGTLEEIASLEPPTFVFTVPLRPHVDLGEYQKIRLDYDFVEPTEEDVDNALEEMRRMFASTKEIERPIADGDYVLAQVSIYDAEATEESEPLEVREKYAFVVREEAADDEWPFPGFSAALIGLAPGESKTIEHSFADDEAEEALRGKDTRIIVTIQTARALEVPEANDEFAKMAGAENLEALKETLRENLLRERKETYDDEYFTQLLNTIREQAEIKYPPQLVDSEIESIIKNIESRLESQGLNLDLYLRSQEKSREEFIATEVRPAAINQLEQRLIIDALARQLDASDISEEELEAKFQELLNDMLTSGQVKPEDLRNKRAQRNFAEYLTLMAADQLVAQRVYAHLKQIATGQEAQEEAPAPAESEEEAPEAPAPEEQADGANDEA